MKQCKCGSMAFNLAPEIEQGDLCDRHYWQDRAEKSEKDAARYQFIRHGHRIEADDAIGAAIDAAIAKDAPCE